MFETVFREIKNAVDPDALKQQEQGRGNAPVGTSDNPSTMIFTLANCITFARFILTTAFIFLFVNGNNRALALTLYAIAAVTDFLDGQVARRTQTVSWLGKIMDPIMDRYLLLSGVLALLLKGELPMWVAIAALVRDVFLAVGALILKRYANNPIEVIYIGKAATAGLMLGFSLMMLGVPEVGGLGILESPHLPGFGQAPAPLGLYIVYVSIVLSLITAIVYTVRGINIIRYSKQREEGRA